jgi:hypothetical protein
MFPHAPDLGVDRDDVGAEVCQYFDLVVDRANGRCVVVCFTSHRGMKKRPYTKLWNGQPNLSLRVCGSWSASSSSLGSCSPPCASWHRSTKLPCLVTQWGKTTNEP